MNNNNNNNNIIKIKPITTMKIKSLLLSMLCMLALGATMTACSDDDDNDDLPVLNDEGSKVNLPSTRMFILNEGKWGDNNAGLAFYAPNKDAEFIGDIFFKQNDQKMGDLGQSIIKYNNYIYIAVNGSNYLVKLNSAGVEQKRISFVDNEELGGGIRYITAYDGYIYASFYGSAVAKINAETLEIEKTKQDAELNSQFEAVAICNGELYVANSCSPTWEYYNEVFVFDTENLNRLRQVNTVAANPNIQMVTTGNKVFFISDEYAPDYSYTDHVLQVIEGSSLNAKKIGNAAKMTLKDNTLYCINSDTDWSTYATVNTFFTVNTDTYAIDETSFLKESDATTTLAGANIYMLEVNPANGDIYIGTTDYTNNGTIYRFKADGTFVESFDAGGINPSHAVFFN